MIPIAKAIDDEAVVRIETTNGKPTRQDTKGQCTLFYLEWTEKSNI